MDLQEKYLELIFNIVTQQNKRLLREIALREKLPLRDLYRMFIFTRKDFNTFMKTQSSS